MKPPLIAAVLFVAAICLCACGKQEPLPPPQARATPSPTPRDELDLGTDQLKKRADGAIAAVESYLSEQSPQLRVRFQKTVEKLAKDKAKWREKLRAKQKDLQPQIDRLREQVGKVDNKTRDRIVQELARLQDQSKDTDKKLTELEAAGKDAWKSFKARLKEEEVRSGQSMPPDSQDDEDPAAKPTPGPAR